MKIVSFITSFPHPEIEGEEVETAYIGEAEQADDDTFEVCRFIAIPPNCTTTVLVDIEKCLQKNPDIFEMIKESYYDIESPYWKMKFENFFATYPKTGKMAYRVTIWEGYKPPIQQIVKING